MNRAIKRVTLRRREKSWTKAFTGPQPHKALSMKRPRKWQARRTMLRLIHKRFGRQQ